MKLYLSSEGIPDINVFQEFIGKKVEDIKFGLVFHAKDYKPAPEREAKLEEAITYFTNFGITVEVIDLFDTESLDNLHTYDVIWFNGGNTFYLGWTIAESGTKKLLDYIFNENVVYAGDSAGAVMAGPVIDKYGIADDPDVAPYIVTEGLKYIDLGLLPHWGSEEYAAVLGGIEKSFNDDGYETIRLSDNGYLLIENGHIVDKKF